MGKIKLSIIIPVYNEINTVLEVIKRVQDEPHEKEIIIVDDGSNDGTTELLSGIEDPNIKLLLHPANRGKGYAIRSAIPYITGNIAIIQDADLEYDPREYTELIKLILIGKADVVYGSRFLGTHRVFYFYHYLGNIIINLFANLLLNTNFTDIMTGFKIFKSSILKNLILKANGFAFEAEVTCEVFKRGQRVYEIPISYEGRSYEEGKKIKWFDFFICLYWLIRARLRSIDIGKETLLRMRIARNNNMWMYNKIKPYLKTNILEIGAGFGTISRYLISKNRNLILMDINQDYVDYLKTRFIGNPYVEVIQTDISNVNVNLKDKKIDTAICINVLEHIERDIDALKNIKDILIEGGNLAVTVPAHKNLFGTMDKELRHYRRYSKEELFHRLEDAGFIVEKIEYLNLLGAIGWFINYKIFKRKHMPVLSIWVFDKLIPLISKIEKYLKIPFGLCLFAVARKVQTSSEIKG